MRTGDKGCYVGTAYRMYHDVKEDGVECDYEHPVELDEVLEITDDSEITHQRRPHFIAQNDEAEYLIEAALFDRAGARFIAEPYRTQALALCAEHGRVIAVVPGGAEVVVDYADGYERVF